MQNKTFRILYIFFMVIFLGFGIGTGLFYYYSKELPPLSELQRYEMKVGSEVYDRNDELIHIFSVEKRQLTNLSELPPYLTRGIVAVEDKNFYDHWGMDMVGFFRALLIDIKKGSFSQGASTITQQLARNMFLTLDKKIPRKIKELILAVRIEKHYSKDEILEMYLNKSPFGPGLYGVEVASAKYFNKKAKDLNIPEAALIIGMPQLPSAYYPFRYPERAVLRRNIVLNRMLEENVISLEEYEMALQDTLKLYNPKTVRSCRDYFIEYIRPLMERKYGTTALFTGGLKIYTTLDTELQEFADSVLNKHLIEFENKNEYEIKYEDYPVDTINIVTDYVQGGIFSIEPETGYVRILIGGRNYNHSKLNRMMQSLRQPGSAFKPIIYTTALVNDYTPATVFKDEPTVFIQSDTLFWKPKNYTLRHFGYTRMRTALQKSRNVYSAKIVYDIGPKKVVDFGRRFGLSTPLYPYYTLSVGSVEVFPYELITAFTTFPNGGERVKPIFVRRVEDDQGNILESSEPEKIRVVDDKTSFLITSMLESVIDAGTGIGVRWRGYKWAAGGKTGTTDDFRDAWFIGFNRKLVTGIWVGFDDNTSLGEGQSGAVAALPPWPKIMKKAMYLDSPEDYKGNPIINGSIYDFKRPAGITKAEISKETGLLPKSSYEEKIEEYFIEGTAPTLLSDSLEYNFYPTIYRENENDSLVIDLGGVRYIYPDSIIYVETIPDTTKPDSILIVPEHVPPPIDLSGATIIKNHEYVTRPDSLLINQPPWMKTEEVEVDTLDAIDKLIEELLRESE